MFYFPEDSSNEEEGQETPAARNIQFFCSDASDRYAPENQPDYPVYFDILTPAGLCLTIIRPAFLYHVSGEEVFRPPKREQPGHRTVRIIEVHGSRTWGGGAGA